MQQICAILVDPQEVMRMGIYHVLRAQDIDVVGMCATSTDALRLAHLYKPDLIVTETQLPDGSGADACRTLRAACPQAQIIFLTSLDCDKMRSQCLAAGSHGYFLKDVGVRELVGAIHSIISRRYLSDIVVNRPSFRKKAPVPSRQLLLSPQERKIPPLVADGKTNKEIGEILGLSDRTVKNYLSNIYLKLQVTRRSQLAAVFARGESNFESDSVT